MASPRAFVSLSLALLLVASPLCSMADSMLYSGDSLTVGQALSYASYTFIMQSDCNLVLYDNVNAIWASGTNDQGSSCYVSLQSDGNLVIYDNNDNAVWASNTNVGQDNTNVGQGNYVLILQRDRNVVIYGGAQWATNTNTVGVSNGMFIQSKATIFGSLPANETTAEAKVARVSMVVNK
ncbi:alpha-D-mannose-specific plant lectins domain-containing protein [Dioscorea alata]|uniref:Alpha-D-mannose-specific plant lectins domain-containing protein n=1 Tax=Dioscorea alata TaxID=55571 RepID=A0ACB7WVA4_DIOAL|nr:alpha-D-mannose-specific plant lectins domain-containing protein [Dioscorea alata]